MILVPPKFVVGSLGIRPSFLVLVFRSSWSAPRFRPKQTSCLRWFFCRRTNVTGTKLFVTIAIRISENRTSLRTSDPFMPEAECCRRLHAPRRQTRLWADLDAVGLLVDVSSQKRICHKVSVRYSFYMLHFFDFNEWGPDNLSKSPNHLLKEYLHIRFEWFLELTSLCT